MSSAIGREVASRWPGHLLRTRPLPVSPNVADRRAGQGRFAQSPPSDTLPGRLVARDLDPVTAAEGLTAAAAVELAG